MEVPTNDRSSSGDTLEAEGSRRAGRAGRFGVASGNRRTSGRDPLRLLAGATALLLLGLACGGETGTEPSLEPADLRRLSSEVDSVEVGGVLADPPLAVRVLNPLGEPVEGVPVRFLLVSGPGQLDANLAVTNGEGIAEAEFRGGSEFGTSQVRVDVPSATNVPSIRFTVVTRPAGAVRLGATGGDGQRAETGSQLPLPFQLRVATPSGTPASGVRVQWTIVQGPPGGRLASDTSFTDPDGATRNLLTLGSEAGVYHVRAHAVGGMTTDTVRFEASAVTSLSSSTTIDSVSPVPLRAGAEATLYGAGFGQRAADVQVRVEGVRAEVLEVSPGVLRVRTPSFSDRCLPEREVGVRALVANEASNGVLVSLVPETGGLELEVGESSTFRGDRELDCLRLSPDDSGREYLLAVGTAARAAGSVTPLRLLLRSAAEDEPTADLSISASRTAIEAEGQSVEGPSGPDVRIREGAVRELSRQGFRRPDRSVRAPSATKRGTPDPGDTMELTFALDAGLEASCTDTSTVIRGVVRAVGRRVVMVEDASAPSGGFGPEEWTALRDEFDETVFPTDSLYFGAPADIDGNGRIVVVFTPRVNALTPRTATGRVGGFFLPLDLTDPGDPEGSGLRGEDGATCAASNEGEILYVAVPDPNGEFSSPVRLDQAFRNARSVAAHELQHLVSAEQRLVLGDAGIGDLGEVWLQEGLAHLAEEVVGLRAMGRGVDENLDWSPIQDDREQLELFNTFHLNNFARLSLFMRQPSATPVLAQQDPGGARGLQMRGFAWSFLRWLGNRRGGPDETALFRRLSSGGPAHVSGVTSVVEATGERWSDLLTGYLLALPLDDRGVPDTPARYRIDTWNLRSVYSGLNENPSSGDAFPLPFPLQVTPLPFSSTAADFEVTASTATYFGLSSTRRTRPLALRLTSQNGAPLDGAAPHLTIVRIR